MVHVIYSGVSGQCSPTIIVKQNLDSILLLGFQLIVNFLQNSPRWKYGFWMISKLPHLIMALDHTSNMYNVYNLIKNSLTSACFTVLCFFTKLTPLKRIFLGISCINKSYMVQLIFVFLTVNKISIKSNICCLFSDIRWVWL